MCRICLLALALLLTVGCKQNNDQNEEARSESEPKGVNNVAYKWGEMALTATANDTERFNPRPTITSRYLGLIFVAVFDAWSR